MNAQERESAHDTMLENGRPDLASLVMQASKELSVLEMVSDPRTELDRLRRFIEKVSPMQSAEGFAALAYGTQQPNKATQIIFDLRSAALSAFQRQFRYAGETLNYLASLLETQSADPAMQSVLDFRERIHRASAFQSNVEIKRWFTMVMAPGAQVMANTGDIIV